MIRICNLSKSYQKDSAALCDINLSIGKGEFVFVTGPSGAGKSTLLRMLFCGEKPNRGQILINGRNITR
ncbi:MAG: ATP-binding cassette domain-containing protein, partial [Desulfuromonadaceae bacterium]|nr:ATP-binding cassette domain-containing protein [Desulfuromonadaceae bacterium]